MRPVVLTLCKLIITTKIFILRFFAAKNKCSFIFLEIQCHFSCILYIIYILFMYSEKISCWVRKCIGQVEGWMIYVKNYNVETSFINFDANKTEIHVCTIDNKAEGIIYRKSSAIFCIKQNHPCYVKLHINKEKRSFLE